MTTTAARFYHEQVIPGTYDPHRVLYRLRDQGILSDYLLYDEGSQVRVACNAFARMVVTEREIICTIQGSTTRTPAIDPFTQIPPLLAGLAGEWRGFAFISFDICRFQYPYTKRPLAPLLEMIIPESEMIFTKDHLQLRSIDSSERYLQALDVPGEARATVQAPFSIPPGDKHLYQERVCALQDGIRAARLQKAILSRCIKIPGQIDVLATHQAGAMRNPAVRSYAGTIGGTRAVGFSPEILMHSTAAGRVLTNPLAGTRPRGVCEADDARLHRELFTDAKEVKEHALSILLAQQEIASVCQESSVRIHDFMAVKPYRTVQHLSSRVSGMLRSGLTAWDALKVLFPGITVSGIDKRNAIEWIDCLEDEARGLYAGAIGWIDSSGASDLAIAIRSAYQYGEHIHLNAGAGIVAESDPEHEFIESCNKMATMSSIIMLYPEGR
jgi:salicylate synthetase